jgi:hypothetical protein
LLSSFNLCLVITVASALVSLGFSIAATVTHSGQTRLMALYAAARSLAFVIVSLGAFWVGSVTWLQASASGMIIVQLCDAAIGVLIQDKVKALGPACTAIVNLGALVWLSGIG